ncbi:MAG: hypothetical protein ACM35E_13505 [Deltaproteobacteria bacterium]|jgi:hypothetical protein
MDRTDKSFSPTLVVLCVIVFFAVITSANATEAGRAKRVLIISTGSRFSAGFAIVHERGMEVLKLCVVQGVQACNLAVPIMAEELAASGKGTRP